MRLLNAIEHMDWATLLGYTLGAMGTLVFLENAVLMALRALFDYSPKSPKEGASKK